MNSIYYGYLLRDIHHCIVEYGRVITFRIEYDARLSSRSVLNNSNNSYNNSKGRYDTGGDWNCQIYQEEAISYTVEYGTNSNTSSSNKDKANNNSDTDNTVICSPYYTVLV